MWCGVVWCGVRVRVRVRACACARVRVCVRVCVSVLPKHDLVFLSNAQTDLMSGIRSG